MVAGDGLSVVELDWTAARAEAAALRYRVFVIEQAVPEALELDDQDPVSLHVLARCAGTAVATGRLTPGGKIGRLAVMAGYRGRGIGAAVLDALIGAASRRGADRVYLDAQLAAEGFYRRVGFRAAGEAFLDAGILHRRMTLALSAPKV